MFAVSTLIGCSAVHIYLDDITVHGIIFAAMVLSAVLLAMKIVKGQNAGAEASTQIRNEDEVGRAGRWEKYAIIRRLTGAGTGMLMLPSDRC